MKHVVGLVVVAVAGTSRAGPHVVLPDPTAVARATLAGTIRNDAGAPIARARVCARSETWLPTAISRPSRCTTSDDYGRYLLGDLIPASYAISVMARTYQPAMYVTADHSVDVALGAGEHRDGLDVALAAGGVEVRGTVTDAAGRPTARVEVRAGWRDLSFPVETDATGGYALWLAPGTFELTADAPGSTEVTASGHAPCRLDLRLEPEAILDGTVIDAATRAPIAGAQVELQPLDGAHPGDDQLAVSDAAGHFHFERLAAARIALVAHTASGYGRLPGAVRVRRGEHVGDVVVELAPGQRVSGRVAIAGSDAPCPEPGVSLVLPSPKRELTAFPDPDGWVHVDGVPPGRYVVSVDCAGFVSRASYPDLVVTDKPVADRTWYVDPGATVRGTLVRASGTPRGGSVHVQAFGRDPRTESVEAWQDVGRDGAFELHGLIAGEAELTVEGVEPIEPAAVERLTIPSARATVDAKLVAFAVGAVHGHVIGKDGAPLRDVDLVIEKQGADIRFAHTGSDGAFWFEDVRDGAHHLTARYGGQEVEQDVTIVAGNTVEVALRLDITATRLAGKLEDAAGHAIGGAQVRAVQERAGAIRAFELDHARTAVTRPDGTFELPAVPPGTYTVISDPVSGGLARADHVAPGTPIALRVQPDGSIAGSARQAGAPAHLLSIELTSELHPDPWIEEFAPIDGHFTLRDLPADTYQLVVLGEAGAATRTIEVAPGAHVTADIELEPFATVTGRIVDIVTGAPAAGMSVALAPDANDVDPDNLHVTDRAGRFTIRRAVRGKVKLEALPSLADDAGNAVELERTFARGGTIDLGTLRAVRDRVARDAPVGALGVDFTFDHTWTVESIDPDGPAARSALRVGDRVKTIDGADISGEYASYGDTLLAAPPGTMIRLGLARGVTIAVKLAPPK
ncbi:MAG TPA: carboxypeptidase regulatory-like domain-containing protein [Kofleriaceae bacterium]|nr:carboxypeptidase regulatory-like domain-containing protein [Kofleriaceae bacterium]